MGQILKDHVKTQIVESAIKDIFENGMIGSSMRKIASNANMTVGNLYRYFKNKDELISFIVEPVLSRINKIIQKNTNQIIDLRDDHFDMSHISIEDIIHTLDELSVELVDIYNETPKPLLILMNHEKVSGNILKWFTKLIMEFMISKNYVHDRNRNRCELLARTYAVSLFAGMKDCLANNELDKNELSIVIKMYFRSCISFIDKNFEDLEV